MPASNGGGAPKDVVLILARELATNIATPMLVFDHNGVLVFFNEPAERILGQSFGAAGEIAPQEWSKRWPTFDLDGNPESLVTGPLSRVITERVPVHGWLRVQGLDHVTRTIQTTAYPLFARADRFVGAVSVFWQDEGPA